MIPGFFSVSAARSGMEITGGIYGAVNRETYSLELHAEGADAPVQWSIVEGVLPAGLHLGTGTTTTATISGVADDDTGYYTVTVRARSASGVVAEREITIGLGEMVSLLHFDGTNGQTTTTDETGRSWSGSGGVQLSTSAPQFGPSASLHSGSGARWQTASAADFIPSSLTIRAWVRPSSDAGAGQFRGVITKRVYNNDAAWTLYQDPGDHGWIWSVWRGVAGGSNHELRMGSQDPVAVNDYAFITCGFEAGDPIGSIYATLNGGGTWIERLTGDGVASLHVSTAPVLVGVLGSSQTNSTQTFQGHIDEVAVIQGAVLYKEDHPVQSEPSDYPQPAPELSVNGYLPAGVADTAYSSLTDITIHGAHAPFSVSVSTGSLPGDWTATVNGGHVEVAGSGVAAGAYTFTLEIEDDDNNTVELPLTVIIE